MSRVLIPKWMEILQDGRVFVSDRRVFPESVILTQLGVDVSFVGKE